MAKILLIGGPLHGDLVPAETKFPLLVSPVITTLSEARPYDIPFVPSCTARDIKIFETSVIRIAPYSELTNRDFNTLLLSTLIKEFYFPLIIKGR